MNILSYNKSGSGKEIASALKVLNRGGIIAYPTESFYALGVSATDDNAVRRLYEIKSRSSKKPLPLIVGDMDNLCSVVKEIPEQATQLIEKYWPGPLTIIFYADGNLPLLIKGESCKVAVRIPGIGAALYLARAFKAPLTATSANISGNPPADNKDDVIRYFGNKVDLIIDSGRSPGGRPSTIVDITVFPPKVVRHGSITLNI